MIAAFSRAICGDRVAEPVHVVEVDVRDAATPPSQAWVASSRPPSPTSTSARSEPLLGEPAEDDRGQQLELGRRRRGARGDPVGGGEDLADEAGEVAGVDRPPVDLRSARGR